MKKVLFLAYIMLSGVAMFGQIDSSKIIDLIQTGGTMANIIRPTNWINGVDNNIVSAIITAVASVVIGLIKRRKEKKKIKRSILMEINSPDSDYETIGKIKGIVENKF